MKKGIAIAVAALAVAALAALAGCGAPAADQAGGSQETSAAATEASQEAPEATASDLAPGEYSADFKTDSTMFHINETKDGKGVLTVAPDGSMSIHVTLVSKRITTLYLGTTADAADDEANWILPTEDEVTYKDGYVETVYGFDIPVPAIGEKYDVALIGEKGKWYDHKVSVEDPQPLEDAAQ